MKDRIGESPLKVIAGCMFAGKSEELIRLILRAKIAGLRVQAFKPDIDNRYGAIGEIRSHNGSLFPAIPVPIEHPSGILEATFPDTQVVAIEEIQFFDNTNDEVVKVIKALQERVSVGVMVAGLPTDFRNEPFGSVPTLLAISDEIVRLDAICTHSDNGEICGRPATRTQRFVNGEPAKYDDPIIQIGGEESYSAMCSWHHRIPQKPKHY